jgi:hypothetical protein
MKTITFRASDGTTYPRNNGEGVRIYVLKPDVRELIQELIDAYGYQAIIDTVEGAERVNKAIEKDNKIKELHSKQ